MLQNFENNLKLRNISSSHKALIPILTLSIHLSILVLSALQLSDIQITMKRHELSKFISDQIKLIPLILLGQFIE